MPASAGAHALAVGFVCPRCAGTQASRFVRGELPRWQCAACRHQTSLLAGTVFEATKLPQFAAVDTFLGNLKTGFAGTCHAFDFAKYAHRYLADVQFRFNRRFAMARLLPRLLAALVSAPPSPERTLRLAEAGR